MCESTFPLTALSEAQRTQARECFAIIRPALEEGVTQTLGSRPGGRPGGPAVIRPITWALTHPRC